MKLRSINEYDQPNCVSIWVGNFISEVELDSYLYKDFEDDFGVIVAGRGRGEMITHAKPVEIIELLRPFSQSRFFLVSAVNECERHGISKSTCAMVEYACAYDAAHVLNSDAPLKFIGAFEYESNSAGNQ